MALTVHKLPDINNLPIGVIHCYLYHDDSIVGLTYPSAVSFMEIGKLKESIDLEGGITDLENVTVALVEDYSAYPEGFWFKLINGYSFDVELMFTVDEGANEVFLFRGTVYKINTSYPEYYLNGTDVVRGIKFDVVSKLITLKNYTMTDLVTTALGYSGATASRQAMRFGELVASMIVFYGDAYSESMCVNNSTDIEFYDELAAAWITWANTYFDCGYTGHEDGYFKAANSYSWPARFNSAFDLLQFLCRHFGVIPRLTFGNASGYIDATPANNLHRIVFNSRGNTVVSKITMVGGILQSDFVPDTARKAKTMRIRDNRCDDTDNDQYYVLNDTIALRALLIPTTFDLDFDIDFNVTTSASPVSPVGSLFDYQLMYYDTSSMATILKMRWWNYHTQAYVELVHDYVRNILGYALINYYYNRFYYGRTQFTRVYAGLTASDGSTSSLKHLQTLKLHDISYALNGSTVTKTYYASEIEKDLYNNKATVVWVEL
jgi:hypothetical protein